MVAVMDTVAASGGYITAIAADHIVARGNTITGSIGVIFQWAEVKTLLDRLGIKMRRGQVRASSRRSLRRSIRSPERGREVSHGMVRIPSTGSPGLVAERRAHAGRRGAPARPTAVSIPAARRSPTS